MAHVNECDASTLFDAPAPDAIAGGHDARGWRHTDGGERSLATSAVEGRPDDAAAFASFGGADAR